MATQMDDADRNSRLGFLIATYLAFRRNHSGAVTVDWVVLTAAIVGLSIAVLTSVSSGTTEISEDLATCTKRVGRLIAREDLDYDVRLRRIQRQCARL